MTRKIIPSEAIVELVRRALNSPKGIRIDCESAGQAINLHQRYNTVRASIIKRDAESEWRTMQMRREENVIFLEPVDAHILRLNISEIED
jgi:hypothetical protein